MQRFVQSKFLNLGTTGFTLVFWEAISKNIVIFEISVFEFVLEKFGAKIKILKFEIKNV